jgi:hypothetical protein
MPHTRTPRRPARATVSRLVLLMRNVLQHAGWKRNVPQTKKTNPPTPDLFT